MCQNAKWALDWSIWTYFYVVKVEVVTPCEAHAQSGLGASAFLQSLHSVAKSVPEVHGEWIDIVSKYVHLHLGIICLYQIWVGSPCSWARILILTLHFQAILSNWNDDHHTKEQVYVVQAKLGLRNRWRLLGTCTKTGGPTWGKLFPQPESRLTKKFNRCCNVLNLDLDDHINITYRMWSK